MIPLVTKLAVVVFALAVQEPQIPAPRGMVNDFANVIPADEAARIERLAQAVRAGSQGEIAIVTLPDLAGRDVGDVALRIGREWGVGAAADIGDRARNAGVVVLLVPKETSQDGRGWISIQVGQGAEGFITDGQSGDIRREATPLLARGEYGPALTLITARLAERYAQEFQFSLDSTLVPPRQVARRGIPPVVFLVLFFVLISIMGRGRRRGGITAADILLPILLSGGRRGGGGGFGGGGFGGGGFGGFGGGGGFSGGGSSGSF